jgi:hypothetical protein
LPSLEDRELALLLARKAESDGIELPAGRDEIEGLTPWAVAARYEDRFDEVLDRSAVREQLAAVRDWSRRLMN